MCFSVWRLYQHMVFNIMKKKKTFTNMELEQYKQQKQQKDMEHSQRSEKYENVTRQRNTFKVYMHVNKHNGRKYIGITCENVNSRWRGGRAYKCNEHFRHAIDKYGWDEGFEHVVLFDNLTQQEAMNKEVELISKYRNTPEGVYNITDGGEHYIQTPESIAKMKETKRKNKTPEHLLRVKLAAQARDFNGEKNPFYGKTHTEETKKILSEKHWSKTDPERFYNSVAIMKTGGDNPSSKQVIRLKDGKIYSCIKNCKTDNNITADTVTQYCKGRRSVFLYMYKEDYDKLSLEEQIKRRDVVLDFLQNPDKYNKSFKKVICLTDNKIYDGCLECAEYYGLTETQVGYQCRNFSTPNNRVERRFMYVKDYKGGAYGK